MRCPGPAIPDQRSREDELVRAHLPLVNYVVNEMANRVPRHVARADLVSAGMEGLAQAARCFDADRGIAFDRYASTRIKGALLDELRRRDWASRSVRAKARKVNAVIDDLTVRLGRVPTTAEIAEVAEMDTRSLASIDEDVHRAVVLNFDALTTGGDGEEVLPSDGRGPDAILLDRERQAYLHDAVAALPDRLRRVVVGYFFEERPMQELADELGVTESRISQMRAEALLLLRDGMNSQLDPEVLPSKESSSRVAKRKAAYYTAVAHGSDYRARLSTPVPLTGASA
jgi:RNA polymerase sigma factor for flagellar operon FliA